MHRFPAPSTSNSARQFPGLMSFPLRLCALSFLLVVVMHFPPQIVAKEEPLIRNPHFENKLVDWSVHVYGAQPTLAIDDQLTHQERPSLRISSKELSDAALGQEVILQPGHFYCFSGWVRTRGLDPKGAPVFGTYQIQKSGGKGVIASGTNHGGDTDWTETAIYFQAPNDGRVRLALFFVGYGKGTGTAWFAHPKLEEIDAAKIPIRISRQPLCTGTISPFQYGQFIEYLCDLVPGMWAEKLYDGSFEGLSPYKFVFLKEKDFREKPWYPSGAVNRAEFLLDPNNPVSGKVSQRIRVVDGAPCTVGVAQDGIFVDKGKLCTFNCFIRQESVSGPVQVRLHKDGATLASCEFQPTELWKKYTARLEPSRRETNATLTIQFRGPGTLWLDNASLMPESAEDGWRPDVVAALRALRPGIIRFGGSVLDDPQLGDFDWRDTVGDPDRRKPFKAWGGLQPTGPGMEEIIHLCKKVAAEPLLCVRFSKRTPREAAEQVEYFNGQPDSPMGKHRVQNGHTDPYAIKYWQVGNERAGPEYENRLADFCSAMKKVDAQIKIFSSYPTPGVLANAGSLLDYVCPHHYECEDLQAEENSLRTVRAMLHMFAPQRPIKIAVTEWNTTAGDAGPRRARLWSLENALACSRYQNLLHRHCDIVEIANRSNLTNSFCSGIIQTDNHRLFKTPTYYAQQLYASQAGDRPLTIISKLPADAGPDFSATLSAKGEAVIIFAVNSSRGDVTRPLDFSAFSGEGREVACWTLADQKRAGEPDIANSFDEPDRVSVTASKMQTTSSRFTYRFPALSLTVLRWKVNDK